MFCLKGSAATRHAASSPAILSKNKSHSMKRIKVYLLALVSCAFSTTASAQNVNEITVNDDRSGRKEVIDLPEIGRAHV